MGKQIAFVGNPNVGKSAWINALSNAQFKVGNWPGVTIEKKEAEVAWEKERYHLIDLPGTYSLDDGENEEGITARFLKEEHVDLIVNVVDATNLSRNLYLTLSLRKLQIPMILIFNFMDEVKKYHMQIQIQELSEYLGVPIYPYSAFDETGHAIVQKAICTMAGKYVYFEPLVSNTHKKEYEMIYHQLQQAIPYYMQISQEEVSWLAYNTFLQNEDTYKQLQAWDISLDCFPQEKHEEDIEFYAIISDLTKYIEDNEDRLINTRRLDKWLLHPYVGIILCILIFMFIMMFVFQGSAPFNDYIDFLMNTMVMKYANALFFFLPPVAKDLLLHGILAGVGGVLVFIPLMAFLYFVLSFLEESGYMSRIAFLMDPFMHHFHLNGKSFVSLLLGFGCNVPAVYAARTMDNEKQKRLTALLVPFMSCGARLPVYMLFAAAFFSTKAAVMVLSMYGIGILIALLCALICSHFHDFKDDSLLVLELPPYRMPSIHVILKKVSLEVKGYIKKATSIVMWAMIVLWALSYFPNGNISDSYIAQFGKALTPIYEPLGFGTRWESIAALPGSIIAKETVVGFFDQVLLHNNEVTYEAIDPSKDAKTIVYELGSTFRVFLESFIPHYDPPLQDDTLVHAVQQLYTDKLANLRAFSYMVYILLSIPCIMTLQAIVREYGKKLMITSILLMMIIPYVLSFGIFQIFSLLY